MNRRRIAVALRAVSWCGLPMLGCELSECPPDEPGRAELYDALVSEIAAQILPERRGRINHRVIKKKFSAWPKKRPEHRSKVLHKKRFRDCVKILRGTVLGFI